MIIIESVQRLHCNICKEPRKFDKVIVKKFTTIKDIEESDSAKNRKVYWVRGELVPSRTGST